MDIKVHIEFKNEFDQINTGISESKNIDKDAFTDNDSESILDHFIRAYIALGYEKSWMIDEMVKYIANNKDVEKES